MVVMLEEFVPLSLPFLSNKLFRTRWLMHSFVPYFFFAEASRRTNEQIETPTRLACLLSLPNLVSQSTFPACSSIPARTRSMQYIYSVGTLRSMAAKETERETRWRRRTKTTRNRTENEDEKK